MTSHLLKCVAFAALLAASSGCGAGKVDVSGTVTCNGRPVTTGSISLIASDKIQYEGPINADGTFTIVGVPSGEVKIGVYSPATTVVTTGVRPVAPNTSSRIGGAPRETQVTASAQNLNPVPERFADPLNSGLTGVVGSDPLVVTVQGS